MSLEIRGILMGQSLSENWDGAIGRDAVTKFRRAYLKALAEHPEP